MDKIISLKDVIDGRTYRNNKWCNMTLDEMTESLNKIKEILYSTCRGESKAKKAIQRMNIANLPTLCGIFDRLTVNGYYAGQDYQVEMNFIKKQILKAC